MSFLSGRRGFSLPAVLFAILSLFPSFLTADDKRDEVEVFFGIAQSEAENFSNALEMPEPFEVSDFRRGEFEDLTLSAFEISGKEFKVVSRNDAKDFRRELRKVFSAELGELSRGDNEPVARIYNKYKSMVAAKGNLAVSDLVMLKSIDGRRGTYIVSGSGRFKLEEEEDEQTLFFLKPLKAVDVFDNARLEKKGSGIMLDVSYALFFSNPFAHSADVRIKFTRAYPIYLNAGVSYLFWPGISNSAGIRLGAESFISMDGIYDIQTGLGMFAGFGFSVAYDFQSVSMAYIPEVELGLRWFFLCDCAITLAVRFMDEFRENAAGEYLGTVLTGLVAGVSVIL